MEEEEKEVLEPPPRGTLGEMMYSRSEAGTLEREHAFAEKTIEDGGGERQGKSCGGEGGALRSKSYTPDHEPPDPGQNEAGQQGHGGE